MFVKNMNGQLRWIFKRNVVSQIDTADDIKIYHYKNGDTVGIPQSYTTFYSTKNGKAYFKHKTYPALITYRLR